MKTGKVFMIPVESRGTDMLLPIIREWILPGTIIISDYWRAYDCLKDEGYQHLKVNHSLTFKDPETGATTNTIKGELRHAKAQLPGYHHKKAWYPQYLAKYMFIRSYRIKELDPMIAFFEAAGKLYNGIDSGPTESTRIHQQMSQEEIQEELVLLMILILILIIKVKIEIY